MMTVLVGLVGSGAQKTDSRTLSAPVRLPACRYNQVLGIKQIFDFEIKNERIHGYHHWRPD